MKSDQMMGVLDTYASNVLSTAGEGYAKIQRQGKTRANIKVYPDTPHAYYSNLKHNTLLKALKGSK
ncbi:MAG: hypothetical protein SPI59_01345 [Finegoldia sp.]|nr:hypothetical protein [Finegoldia sp.]